MKIYFNSCVISLCVFSAMLLTGCQQEKSTIYSDINRVSSNSAISKTSELFASLDIYEFDKPVKAPEFKLSSSESNTVQLEKYRGKVVMLSFWSTW